MTIIYAVTIFNQSTRPYVFHLRSCVLINFFVLRKITSRNFQSDWIIFWLHDCGTAGRQDLDKHKAGISPHAVGERNKHSLNKARLLTCSSLHGTDFSQVFRRQASGPFRRFCCRRKRAVVNWLWTLRGSRRSGIRRISQLNTISHRCTHVVVDIRCWAVPRTKRQTLFETILSPSRLWRIFPFSSWRGWRGNAAFAG